MANAVARRIAIRAAVAAKRDGGTEVSKAPRLKVARGLSFAADADKVGLTVSRGELAVAMGVEGARGDLEVGQAILMVSPAVSQPAYDHGGEGIARTGARVEGFDGVVSLHDDFGRGALRRLWLDGRVVADMMAVEGFAEAFATLQVLSDARQETRDARFSRLVAASRAKGEARRAAMAETEALAA